MNECRDFTECFNPQYPDLRACKEDYNTDFPNWLADSFAGGDSPVVTPDCFITDNNAPIPYDSHACCPIWANGENTYDYLEIEFYTQQ